MHLLPDGAFHTFLLPQDNVALLVITDVLSAGSHSLFEMMNKIRECGASCLIIDLLSSAVTMKENEQQTLKEQLSLLLAVLFHSEVPRFRAVETLYTVFWLFSVFRTFDGRHRIAVDPLNFTVYSPQTLPIERRTEGKYSYTHQRLFLSNRALNFDRIIAEYTEPLKPDYLNGR